MSKNITIQEGNTTKTLTGVNKLVTNTVGGGTQNWVPEDEASQYVNTGELTANENGTYIASDDGYIGYSRVEVRTASRLTTKSITENGSYDASDDGYDGYSSIDVNVEGSVPATLITKEITENGTYNARDDEADGYSSVTVNVQYPHGKVVVPGMNHVPVSQRIKTRDFIEDFDEKLFNFMEPYISDTTWKLQMEQLIRYGGWIPYFGLQRIYDYDNLILFGYGGFANRWHTTNVFCYGIYGIGVMDETANITITNIGADRATLYLYNDNCFAKNNGIFAQYRGQFFSGGDIADSFITMFNDIDNNIRIGNSGLMTTLDLIPHDNSLEIATDLPNLPLMTNLITSA